MPKTKEEKPDEEIFVEREEKHPWDARPLTLEGTARLIQLLGGIMADAGQRAQVQGLLQDGVSASGWSTLLGVLGREQLAELLSIITGKPVKWVEKNYSLLNASRAIGQFWKSEDLVGVLKNLNPTDRQLPIPAVGNAGSPEP